MIQCDLIILHLQNTFRCFFKSLMSKYSNTVRKCLFFTVEGYTKNQAVKNMPMASSTTVRWGNTAGFTGLVYLVMASNSCTKHA